MKTIKKQFRKGLNYLIQIHEKTSSFAAQMVGPIVFNYGTKEKNWRLSTNQLLQFPEGSLGKEMGKFLKKNRIEPLTNAEYHDVHHVLFDYSISFKDEVALQFFLHGNGKKSIASISTLIGAWCILPMHWKYLKASYQRGKNCKDISLLNLKTDLYQNLKQIKNSLFNKVSH